MVTAPPLPRLDPPWSVTVVRPGGDPDEGHAAAHPADDVALVADWMAAPHVAERWGQAWPQPQWRAEIARQLAGDHSRPCLVARDGIAVAYLEVYRAVRDRLAAYYPALPHDLGVHIAVGDPAECGRGLGSTLLAAVARGLFAADPLCTRVVAEPDETNTASVAAFTRAGFRDHGRVRFPHKTSALLIRSRTATDAPTPGEAR